MNNSEEEINGLKKQVDELRKTIGYIASSLNNFMNAMTLEEKPKEYSSRNAFRGTIKCLVDKGRIKVGSSIDDCLSVIEEFISYENRKMNFPAGVPGEFHMWIDVLKNHIKKSEKEKSSKTVRFNYYGCFPKEGLEITFCNGVVTKISLHIKTDCEVLLESLVREHLKEEAGKVPLL